MWGKLARLGGTKAPKSVPKSGRPLKLEREHWKTVRRLIIKSPAASGFESELWTLPMIAEYIERQFGVKCHEDHLNRFVRGLGLSRCRGPWGGPASATRWRSSGS
jgi:transposase